MIEARWQPLRDLPGFEVDMKLAMDKGSLRGDNFGLQLQVAYTGALNLKKK